ncbi:unnamed protein product [Hymenolepis diminuta]|uniref:HA2 domain-containing protein n=1 Tax=Hymenolepis diminuta TaxID=6216 RepID=A0A0R3SD75_HYMDI|nr:unnamed protein product [Hymenolepis diminuta]
MEFKKINTKTNTVSYPLDFNDRLDIFKKLNCEVPIQQTLNTLISLGAMLIGKGEV